MRGRGPESFGKKIKILNMGVGKNIRLKGTIYTPVMQALEEAETNSPLAGLVVCIAKKIAQVKSRPTELKFRLF